MSSKGAATTRIMDQFQELIAGSVLNNERIARSLGLSVVDWQAFGVIARAKQSLTAGEISSLTRLPTSTTTRVLDRLEHQGFVNRQADQADRRRIVIRARPEVMERFTSDNEDNPYTEIKESMQDIHSEFTLEELLVVERYLRAVNSGFRSP